MIFRHLSSNLWMLDEFEQGHITSQLPLANFGHYFGFLKPGATQHVATWCHMIQIHPSEIVTQAGGQRWPVTAIGTVALWFLSWPHGTVKWWLQSWVNLRDFWNKRVSTCTDVRKMHRDGRIESFCELKACVAQVPFNFLCWVPYQESTNLKTVSDFRLCFD